MTSSGVHIGKKIEEIFKKYGCSKSWLANEINCDRSNINNIFTRESIDTELLFKISVALHYNFFDEYNLKIEP